MSFAQTWVGNRTTPTVAEIATIDATGELGWPYGFEDLAGDGATFMQPEQSVDVRTAYAVTTSNRFLLRSYVSDANSVGGNVILFVFVDSDEDVATGGPADDPAIDAGLTTDPTAGGYEYVIAVRGNESVVGAWEWREPQGDYQELMLMPGDAEAEAGQDADPIGVLDDEHGYLQVSANLDVLGLTPTCDARLFLRTVDQTGNGPADEDIGEQVDCIPVDSDNDGVPDVVVVDACEDDDQCPADGICVDGTCIIPSVCVEDDDCAGDDTCEDGICRATGGDPCDTQDECDGLVCDSGTCAPCSDDASCGDGFRCNSDGRCVAGGPPGGGGAGGGIALQPGDEIQGGACACRTGATTGSAWAFWLLIGGGAAAAWRRRRRQLGTAVERGEG